MTPRNEFERQRCLAVYEAAREGLNPFAASKRAGVSDDAARRWLKNPTKYDPYIDEIAVMRALEGERSVWDALTVWEREIVLDKLNDVKRGLPDWEWKEYLEDFAAKLTLPSPRVSRGLRWRTA